MIGQNEGVKIDDQITREYWKIQVLEITGAVGITGNEWIVEWSCLLNCGD